MKYLMHYNIFMRNILFSEKKLIMMKRLYVYHDFSLLELSNLIIYVLLRALNLK